MKVDNHIAIDKDYRWKVMEYDHLTIHYIGSLPAMEAFQNLLLNGQSLHPEELRKRLSFFHGHFSFIIKADDFILAAVDRIRSYPVLYIQQNKFFCVSNSGKMLQETHVAEKINDIGLLEFKMAGFITGRETLYEQLYQLQAGEYLIYDLKSNNLIVDRYYRFFCEETRENEEALIREFSEINDKVFKRIIEESRGEPIYVPLSGGLDSRLVLCHLKRLGHKNLHAFSYGPSGNYDAKWAQFVAKKIGVPWHFVPYTTNEIRSFFNNELRKKYWKFASHFCSLPFMVDEYALHVLKNKKLLKENALIINGQSGDFISGGHCNGEHQKAGPQDQRTFRSDEIAESIFKKHFSMNGALATSHNKNLIFQKIFQILNLSDSKLYNVQELVKHYEWWEWQERQAKYVVNGQRSYDYFGFRWYLPLWETEYLDFWMKVSYAKKFRQHLYKAYLSQVNLYGIFRDFKPKAWNWQRGSLVVLPIGVIIKRVFGRKISELFYRYASYFGKYHHHFAPFGLWKWAFNAKRLRNPLTFYIELFLKENSIKQ